MLISCNSCNSKYLLNSADLKPSGRTVKCANCGNQWYQENISNEDENIVEKITIPPAFNEDKSKNIIIPNLPSTYVKEQKVSAINSILVTLFVFIFILGFWFFKNVDINNLVLFKFYIDEFIFNFQLIVSDIAKIIHQIINL